MWWARLAPAPALVRRICKVSRAGAAASPGADMCDDFVPMGAEDTGTHSRIRTEQGAQLVIACRGAPRQDVGAIWKLE